MLWPLIEHLADCFLPGGGGEGGQYSQKRKYDRVKRAKRGVASEEVEMQTKVYLFS
jgi:hypothetical protein